MHVVFARAAWRVSAAYVVCGPMLRTSAACAGICYMRTGRNSNQIHLDPNKFRLLGRCVTAAPTGASSQEPDAAAPPRKRSQDPDAAALPRKRHSTYVTSATGAFSQEPDAAVPPRKRSSRPCRQLVPGRGRPCCASSSRLRGFKAPTLETTSALLQAVPTAIGSSH